MAKGYIYAEFEVTHLPAWEKYVPLAQASLAEFGARYVVRGGNPEVLEGDPGARRISVIEFESRENAREWYNSPKYQAAKAMRQSAGNVNVLLLSGPEA